MELVMNWIHGGAGLLQYEWDESSKDRLHMGSSKNKQLAKGETDGPDRKI